LAGFSRWFKNTGMAIAARIANAKKPPTSATATLAAVGQPCLAGGTA
jgi:hypothetical protein